MATVAFLGAGSMKFTRKLCRDIMMVPELDGSEFRLTDVDEKMLKASAELLKREVAAHGLSFRVEAFIDRREALQGAEYILSVVRIGGLEMWGHDVEIPLRYGVDQCIGDTLGPGGIMYGQRGVPALLEFCRDIREVAKPGAWLLNYANPMSILTWAAIEAGGVNVLGLCHGVQHTTEMLCKVLDVPQAEFRAQVGGVNHMAWFTRIEVGGRPVGCGDLLAGFDRHPEIARRERCRMDVLRRTGYFNTESNGFTTELLPWYRKRPDLLGKWTDPSFPSPHDSGVSLGGYKGNVSARDEFMDSMLNLANEPVEPLDPSGRSIEHASYIIEAMETGRPYRGTLNLRNGSCIPNLPPDCVIEAPCYVDALGVSLPAFDPLPDVCAAICQAMVSPQRLAVRAALTGDVGILKQAVMMDPLTAAVCSTDEISSMVDEMLEAGRPWLPQYAASGT